MENRKPVVLVVDDNPSNINILLNLLGKYDTIPCTNGKSAIDIAMNEEIDLILLDIVMPETNGFTVCEILKANDKTKHIPIIFISAKHDLEDITKGFELGGVDYITKPFNPIELQCRVATHVQLASYQRNLESKNTELELLNEKIKEFAKKELENMQSKTDSFLGSGNIDFSSLIDNMNVDK